MLLLLELLEHLLLEAVPEPELLLLGVEDHLGVHAGAEAQVVPALLAFPPAIKRMHVSCPNVQIWTSAEYAFTTAK